MTTERIDSTSRTGRRTPIIVSVAACLVVLGVLAVAEKADAVPRVGGSCKSYEYPSGAVDCHGRKSTKAFATLDIVTFGAVVIWCFAVLPIGIWRGGLKDSKGKKPKNTDWTVGNRPAYVSPTDVDRCDSQSVNTKSSNRNLWVIFALLFPPFAIAGVGLWYHMYHRAAEVPSTGMLSSGYTHTCAVFSNTGLSCWGANSYGQLGDGTTEIRAGQSRSATEIDLRALQSHRVPGFEAGSRFVSAGSKNTCAITLSGELKCWGANDYGQLGNNTQAGSTLPTKVLGFENGATAVSVGDEFACAIASEGTLGSQSVKCWGKGVDGRLGDGTGASRTVPVQVVGLEGSIVAVSAGYSHACAVISGSAKCWGYNQFGQLGNGTTANSHVPTQVAGLETGVVAISAGGNHTCAIVNDGIDKVRNTVSRKIRCWGRNKHGQVGDGTTSDALVPKSVLDIDKPISESYSFNAAFVSAGFNHTCAALSVASEKRVVCWGSNAFKQLGGYQNSSMLPPVQVDGLRDHHDLIAISSGANHSCLIKENTETVCWGYNRSGQLGYGYYDPHAVSDADLVYDR